MLNPPLPPRAESSTGDGDYLTWYLLCPWCSIRAPGPFLLDASLRLARHTFEAHRYELAMFEIAVTQVLRDEVAA